MPNDKEEFRSFLRALPKCEHHLHLEGALTPEILFKLAAKNGISLPSDDQAFSSPEALAHRYQHFTSLDDFLHYYYIGMSVLIDAADFEALAWDYFEHAAADGVVHAEVFFDPQAHLSRGVSYEVILDGFTAARSRATQDLGISSELICCFLRHLPPPECESTFALTEVQASFKRGDIAGIGLDSSEKDFPPALFTKLYRDAAALGLRRTAHAGEEGPSEYIRSALDDLHASRIDHGIRLADDESLLQRIATQHTLLTLCPISNVFLRCVRAVSDLPIRKFLEAGVPFSLNSDDPAYFGGNYILANYVAVHDAFALSVTEWTTICENSIRGSWCGEERKREMEAALRRVVEEWQRRWAAT